MVVQTWIGLGKDASVYGGSTLFVARDAGPKTRSPGWYLLRYPGIVSSLGRC